MRSINYLPHPLKSEMVGAVLMLTAVAFSQHAGILRRADELHNRSPKHGTVEKYTDEETRAVGSSIESLTPHEVQELSSQYRKLSSRTKHSARFLPSPKQLKLAM